MKRRADTHRLRAVVAGALEQLGVPGNKTEWLRKLSLRELGDAWDCLQTARRSGSEYWAGRVDLEDAARDQLIDSMRERISELEEQLAEGARP